MLVVYCDLNVWMKRLQRPENVLLYSNDHVALAWRFHVLEYNSIKDMLIHTFPSMSNPNFEYALSSRFII